MTLFDSSSRAALNHLIPRKAAAMSSEPGELAKFVQQFTHDLAYKAPELWPTPLGRFLEELVARFDKPTPSDAAEAERLRQVIREYVAHVESGERFDALVDAVPGLESDDGAYPTGELDRLRAELARRDTTIAAVRKVADDGERQATRWADPLPVPEWVGRVRAALSAPVEADATEPAVGRCGHPLTFGGQTSHCALPADHRGWHRSDRGTEWSDGSPAEPTGAAEPAPGYMEFYRRVGAVPAEAGSARPAQHLVNAAAPAMRMLLGRVAAGQRTVDDAVDILLDWPNLAEAGAPDEPTVSLDDLVMTPEEVRAAFPVVPDEPTDDTARGQR